MNYQAMNMLNELPLLNMVGGLFIGLPDSHIIEGMTKCANELRLPLAVLTAEEIRKKYQVFKVRYKYRRRDRVCGIDSPISYAVGVIDRIVPSGPSYDWLHDSSLL